MTMRLYRLFPLIGPSDPQWQPSMAQGAVVVRATSSDEARALAARADWESSPIHPARDSAFSSPAFYGVREEVLCNFSITGLPMILSGTYAGYFDGRPALAATA